MPSLKTLSSKTRQQQTNHGSGQQPGMQQLPPVTWKTAAPGPGVARAAPSGVAVSEVSAAVEELHAQLEVSSALLYCCHARQKKTCKTCFACNSCFLLLHVLQVVF